MIAETEHNLEGRLATRLAGLVALVGRMAAVIVVVWEAVA